MSWGSEVFASARGTGASLLGLLEDRLLRNAGYLFSVTLFNAGAGFLFWLLAARLYTAEAVGFASSVISIVTLLGGLSTIGLGTGLIRFLPGYDSKNDLLNAALTLTVGLGLLTAAGYLVVVRRWTPSLAALSARPVYAVGLLAFVVASGMSTVLRTTYLAWRRAEYSAWASLIYNGLRVALVAVLADFAGAGLVAAIAVGFVASDLVGLVIYMRRLQPDYRPRPVWSPDAWRLLVPFSSGNYLAQQIYRAPMLLATPIALERLGPAPSAHFYVSWMIGNMLVSPATALATSSFAEGSYAPSELRMTLLRAGRYAAALTIPLAVIVGVAAPLILGLFGPSYVQNAGLLRWLALSAPLMAFAHLYFSGLRVRQRMMELIGLPIVGAAGTFLISLPLIDRLGVEALGVGWFLAQLLIAAVGIFRMVANGEVAAMRRRSTYARSARLKLDQEPLTVAAIPCHNEERFIADVVRRSLPYVDRVVVVDDGSSDRTARVAEEAGAYVVRHRSNRGPGAAARSCLRAGVKFSADVLVTLDGDGQHAPEEIPDVMGPILAGEANLVIGSRFLGKTNNVARYRKFGIDVITFLYNVGCEDRITDAQSCFRAYGPAALKTIRITDDGFGFSVQSLIQARRAGLHIAERSISCLYHEGSHSANPVLHGVGVALDVVKYRALGPQRPRADG